MPIIANVVSLLLHGYAYEQAKMAGMVDLEEMVFQDCRVVLDRRDHRCSPWLLHKRSLHDRVPSSCPLQTTGRICSRLSCSSSVKIMRRSMIRKYCM
jgi:hypothetical protein